MKFWSISILLFLFKIGIAQQILPPKFLCASNFPNSLGQDIQLSWEPPTDLCGPVVEYYVYTSKKKNGVYELEHVVTDPTETSVVLPGLGINVNGTANDTVFFYMQTIMNCPGGQVINSDTLDNLPQPPEIKLKYVTINPNTGQIEFRWRRSNGQTVAYLIYSGSVYSAFTEIARVDGRNNTVYIDPRDPKGGPYSYNVLALSRDCEPVDGIEEIGIASRDPHNNIELNLDPVNKCDRTVDLRWNAYNNFQGITGYIVEVTRVFEGDTLKTFTTLSNNQLTFRISELNKGELLSVRVGANLPFDVTAWSNIETIEVEALNPPVDAQIRRVSYEDGKMVVEAYGNPDETADIKSLRLDKSTNGSTFISSGILNPADTLNASFPLLFTFEDNNVDPLKQTYFYKLVLIDDCNGEHPSGVANSFKPAAEVKKSTDGLVTWNAYNIEDGIVDGYTVQRFRNGFLEKSANVDASQLSFTDELVFNPGDTSTWDTACYVIQANYTLTLKNGSQESLVSVTDEVCIAPTPVIVYPSAFAPNGFNKKFRPIIQFIKEREIKGFTLQIFDRTSNKIFETQDKTNGWDGTFKNEVVMLDSYAYYSEFLLSNDEIISKKGMVVVIR